METDTTRTERSGMGLQVIELFAGVGGFRLGLEDAGHEVIWSNQWEPKIQAQHASNCYVEQFGSDGHTNDDIAKINVDEIPDHDILTGGFPCQDYSVAATLDKSMGLRGEKGVLWWHIDRILRAKRPPFVLLENVNRLLRSPADQRGRDFGVLLKCMQEMGYRVEWRVLNAAHYGYPTKRRRVFIFGAHESTEWGQRMADQAADPGYLARDGFFAQRFPVLEQQVRFDGEKDPDTELPPNVPETSDTFAFHFRKAGVMAEGNVWTRRIDPKRSPIAALQSVLESGVPDKYYVPKHKMEKWEYHKGAKKEKRVTDEGYEYEYSEGGMHFPDPLDQPARTILTSEGGTTGSRSKHIIEDPETGKLRVLTPLECERIMGFPDNWTAGMPENWRYFCMGNALVVGLVKEMGHTLAETVQEPEQPVATEVSA